MERWKFVPGYEGLYEVSDQGKVRSLPRQGKYRVYGGKTRRLVLRNGYPALTLSKDNVSQTRYVHRLVLLAFVGGSPSKLHCTNHKNGNRTDNHLENLEWTTYSENSKHACDVLGTCVPPAFPINQAGEANPQSKLTASNVRYIRQQCEHHYYRGLLTELAKQFNVSIPTISMVVSRKRWSHI